MSHKDVIPPRNRSDVTAARALELLDLLPRSAADAAAYGGSAAADGGGRAAVVTNYFQTEGTSFEQKAASCLLQARIRGRLLRRARAAAEAAAAAEPAADDVAGSSGLIDVERDALLRPPTPAADYGAPAGDTGPLPSIEQNGAAVAPGAAPSSSSAAAPVPAGTDAAAPAAPAASFALDTPVAPDAGATTTPDTAVAVASARNRRASRAAPVHLSAAPDDGFVRARRASEAYLRACGERARQSDDLAAIAEREKAKTDRVKVRRAPPRRKDA